MDSETRFSLSWDEHQKSICSGLSLLQQRGEFVDMTLAADGHHVKVHQMVLSLVSPYIKDLISTAQCPHPVIFLNNISYNTLCSVLEYIYTGEVLVSQDKLSDLVAAGKALHIAGLKEMDNTQPSELKNPLVRNTETEASPKKKTLQEYKGIKKNTTRKLEEKCKMSINSADDMIRQMDLEEEYDEDMIDRSIDNTILTTSDIKEVLHKNNVQYSVSNQGSPQIIFNRFIYTLKYVLKKESRRMWCCADSAQRKCSATVTTNAKNEVIKRANKHSHPFHDDKILKKIRLGTIFTAYNEAETAARNKRSDSKSPEDPQTARSNNSPEKIQKIK